MSSGRVIAETERLIIREMDTDDAAFILELLNTPKFIRYIADRGVRTLDQARGYIAERFQASYAEHGYGLYAVMEKASGRPIGNCGFVRRASLPGPDLGFAFLPQFERQGYGYEAASALIEYGDHVLGFQRIWAITSPDNDASIKLLYKLGFGHKSNIEIENETLNLYCFNLDRASKASRS